MGKKKRWQLLLIVVVALLTLYNILPTVFYYSKPLNKPIEEKKALEIAHQISDRVNDLESQSIDWLQAYCKNLSLKPSSIKSSQKTSAVIEVSFNDESSLNQFRRYWPQAGNSIPFPPARLTLAPGLEKENTAYIQRSLTYAADDSLFRYTSLETEHGTPSPLFYTLVSERANSITRALSQGSSFASIFSNYTAKELSRNSFFLNQINSQIEDISHLFGDNKSFNKAYLEHILGVAAAGNGEKLIQALEKQDNSKNFQTSIRYLKDKLSLVKDGEKSVLTEADVLADLKTSFEAGDIQTEISFRNSSLFFEKLVINWENKQFSLELTPLAKGLLSSEAQNEMAQLKRDAIQKLIYQEIAELARATGENFKQIGQGHFTNSIVDLSGAQSLLALDLSTLGEKASQGLVDALIALWQPQSSELSESNFPVHSFQDYTNAEFSKKQFGLVVFTPVVDKAHSNELKHFKTTSIYLVAKGMQPLFNKIESSPNDNLGLTSDLGQLNQLLSQMGFVQYIPDGYGFPEEFKEDIVFELPDFPSYFTRASREHFKVYPSSRCGVLEFSDLEQRIRVENQIGTSIHEDLLLWRDEYYRAQVSPDTNKRFEIPAPTKSPFWSNLRLSCSKYFRGDTRKILSWGMDLSGGKTVQIGLRDLQNRPVTDEPSLKEAVNELYTRLNKLGVSEVSPHIEGQTIVVDFPGSQNLNASELINASSMTFHVVNEPFAHSYGRSPNPQVEQAAQTFLQEVWNEALVTNKTDIHSINELAYARYKVAEDHPNEITSPTLKALYNAGLRLANPMGDAPSSAFDDALSSVARYRGNEPSSWKGQTHPLMIVFHQYALQGRDIENVRADYSPSEGNTLNFVVKSSYTNKEGLSVTPQKDFEAWTAPFAAAKVAGTDNAKYNDGNGWRMVTILNGEIINSASIRQALSTNVQVSGNFSQSEVNKLVADLKAGSLSYIPEILAETNVSPELGKTERSKGISAAFIGLLLVIGAMVWYYRFGGFIASCALVFNLLIIWAALQNIDAALTLEGIAGIILTMGMAVDANVLVFERIREEFAKSNRIAQAINAGYKRAFTAIFDSNITTIIAAIILLNFDSGPIKAFAVTLIIGILSSMFTALFMTRYFFSSWVKTSSHKALNMSNLASEMKFNFLKKARIAMLSSLAVIVIGCGLVYTQKQSILGMDFTGGYALSLTLDENSNDGAEAYREKVAKAFGEAGASDSNFMIRTLNRPNQMRIQFAHAMDLPGQPFYNLSQEGDNEITPKINWVVSSLENQGLKLQANSAESLDQSWVAMSGQLSETMRDEAIIGLFLAMICILCYITFRFEFKYATAAIVALAHDCLITLGILGLLRAAGIPIQINLSVVAAIMTIIGYSLNDTIIIFDRIREDLHVQKKMSFKEIINLSINATLTRTLLTSGTTLLVLLALLVLGGTAIFEFSLVMTIGVIVGTFSSIFIASPVMLFFHKKEKAKA